MGRIVEIFVFDHTYDTILVCSMVHEGFYDENDEILINATAFTANEPNMGDIVEICQIATQINVLLYPMREIDEISIMAKVFANTFSNLYGIYGNFPITLTCSSQY